MEKALVAESSKWRKCVLWKHRMEEACVAGAPNGGSTCSGSPKMEEARVAEAPKWRRKRL